MSQRSLEPHTEIMTVLLIGSGVIGSVYGGLLALAGHRLWVLAYGDRERQLIEQGIVLHNIDAGKNEVAKVELAQIASDRVYDLIIVAVQTGQLASTFPTLRTLRGAPHIIFFGNNPYGHAAIPDDLQGSTELGFPGVAGNIQNGVVRYVQVTQQPTTLETSPSPVSSALQAALESRGFSVKRTADMDGWLAYHAVFISCILMALQKAEADPKRLGHNSKLLRLMCRAIEEGFASLKAQHIHGLARNLAILHTPLLRPIAVRYWSSVMCSHKGELYFAAHLRRASTEVKTLVNWVSKHVVRGHDNTHHIKSLIGE